MSSWAEHVPCGQCHWCAGLRRAADCSLLFDPEMPVHARGPARGAQGAGWKRLPVIG